MFKTPHYEGCRDEQLNLEEMQGCLCMHMYVCVLHKIMTVFEVISHDEFKGVLRSGCGGGHKQKSARQQIHLRWVLNDQLKLNSLTLS